MRQRLRPDATFLWADESAKRLANVKAGMIVVSPGGPDNPKRATSALIHDWVGSVFIPGATLDEVLHVLRDYAGYKTLYHPTVTESKTIALGNREDRFSMLLAYRSMFLNAAVATENTTSYVRLDDRRAYSISQTTRVREIENYGQPAQRVLREGEGSGVIWRLFTIARYAERDGGVYYEVEALGLTRDIPPSLRWLADPIVRRVSRASLFTSLRDTEGAVKVLVASRESRGPMTARNDKAGTGHGLQH